MEKKKILQGMSGFTVIWAGQLVSLLGSGMTAFALAIWAWQKTGQATALALAMFFGFGPVVLLSPLAGALVDRGNRKMILIVSDLAAGISTIAVLILYSTGQLEIWHIYVVNVFAGSFGAFQFPAYSAAVSTMLEKKHYGRANGMIALAGSASGIFAPILAGALIGVMGIVGILAIDIVTFVFAIFMLVLVRIPQPKQSTAGAAGRGNLWQESMYGFKYIFSRPSLLGMQLVFFATNLIVMFGFTVMVPMILARTNDNSVILGSVQSIGAIGGVLGGLLLSIWGGPKRKVHGVLMGMILGNLLGGIPMGIATSLLVWGFATFMNGAIIPILNGSNQAIWQAKVPPDVQGRVFAARRMIAQISAPVAMLAAGPLADYVFEPAMAPGGALVPVFGWLVGTGPGAGMGLMFVFTGVIGTLVGLTGYLFPVIRNIETLMPDHDTEIEAAEAEEDRPESAELPITSPPAVAFQEKLQELLDLRQQWLSRTDHPDRERALRTISAYLKKLGQERTKEINQTVLITPGQSEGK